MTNQEFKELSDKVNAIVETLKKAEETRLNNGTIINNNFEILNDKIEHIDKRIGVLHKDTNKNFDQVKLELVKIQKTTGHEEIFHNMQVVGKKTE